MSAPIGQIHELTIFPVFNCSIAAAEFRSCDVNINLIYFKFSGFTVDVTLFLRDDLKDLLGRMYLEYAILPVREERLTDLTWVAARLCLFSLISLLGILAMVFVLAGVVFDGARRHRSRRSSTHANR